MQIFNLQYQMEDISYINANPENFINFVDAHKTWTKAMKS